MTVKLKQEAPNFTSVEMGYLTIYFSYETAIGFHVAGKGYTAVENQWGPTTGKHLNRLQPDRKKRVSLEAMNAQLEITFRDNLKLI